MRLKPGCPFIVFGLVFGPAFREIINHGEYLVFSTQTVFVWLEPECPVNVFGLVFGPAFREITNCPRGVSGLQYLNSVCVAETRISFQKFSLSTGHSGKVHSSGCTQAIDLYLDVVPELKLSSLSSTHWW